MALGKCFKKAIFHHQAFSLSTIEEKPLQVVYPLSKTAFNVVYAYQNKPNKLLIYNLFVMINHALFLVLN